MGDELHTCQLQAHVGQQHSHWQPLALDMPWKCRLVTPGPEIVKSLAVSCLCAAHLDPCSCKGEIHPGPAAGSCFRTGSFSPCAADCCLKVSSAPVRCPGCCPLASPWQLQRLACCPGHLQQAEECYLGTNAYKQCLTSAWLSCRQMVFR